MPRLLLIVALAFWSLTTLARPPTTEEQLAHYHDDCLASMQAMNYGAWYARRICNCATEHLEEGISAAAENEPQNGLNIPPEPIDSPNCL